MPMTDCCKGFSFSYMTAQNGEEVDCVPDYSAIERYSALFRALRVLGPPRNHLGQRVPVKMTAGAHRVREELSRSISALISLPDTSNRMKGSLGKWSGLFARIALVFHLIDAADAN